MSLSLGGKRPRCNRDLNLEKCFPKSDVHPIKGSWSVGLMGLEGLCFSDKVPSDADIAGA